MEWYSIQTTQKNTFQFQLGFKHIYSKLFIYAIIYTLLLSRYAHCRTIQRFHPKINNGENIGMAVLQDEPRDIMQHCSLLCWAETPIRPEAASNNPGPLSSFMIQHLSWGPNLVAIFLLSLASLPRRVQQPNNLFFIRTEEHVWTY